MKEKKCKNGEVYECKVNVDIMGLRQVSSIPRLLELQKKFSILKYYEFLKDSIIGDFKILKTAHELFVKIKLPLLKRLKTSGLRPYLSVNHKSMVSK